MADVIGPDSTGDVEFSVMLMGGAVASPPVQSPPAVAPQSEEARGLAGAGAAAQGPSGKEVVNDEFWSDLQAFVVQRIRDESEGKRLVGIFKGAWEKDQ